MESGGNCSRETLAKLQKIKQLKEQVTKLTNEVVDEEMVNSLEGDIETCDDLLCQVCPHLYKGDIIINKNDVTKFIVNKKLNCKGFKEGNYCIIDVNPNSSKRGVVYFGEGENVRNRLISHIQKIDGQPTHRLYVHDHFRKQVGEGEDPLKYFKCALIQEVVEIEVEIEGTKGVLKGEKARKWVENQYMDSFRTRGKFGCNYNRTKFSIEDLITSEPTTPKRPRLSDASSATLQYSLQPSAGGTPKERTVSEFLLVALSIRNYSTARENPTRNPQFATSHEITRFMNEYFIEQGVKQQTTMTFLRANVDTNNKQAQAALTSYTRTDWFMGNKIGNNWVFNLNPTKLLEIELAINSNREQLKLVLLDPNNLDDLVSGTLPSPGSRRHKFF